MHRAADTFDDNLEMAINKFSILILNEEYDEALELSLQLLQNHSHNVEVLFLVYSAYLYKDDFPKALEYAKQAHKVSPSAKTWLNLSGVYSEMNEMEKSLKAAEQAVELEPNNYLHHHAKSVCLVALGQLTEAKESSRIMKTLLDKEFPDQSSYFPQLFKLLSEYHRGLGLIYLVEKNYNVSFYHVEKAFEINPNDPLLRLVRGSLFLHRRENEKAREEFIFLMEYEMLKTEAWQGIGFSYLYNKQYELAIKYLQTALEMRRDDILTAIGLYDAYVANKQFEEADRFIQKFHPCFQPTTTQSPTLFKPARPKSYVTVFIWNPKHDSSSEHRDRDYGHAALKVVHQGKPFYFSWFPSGKHYTNQEGLLRSTPSSYGPKHVIKTEEEARKRLSSLFTEKEPENAEEQIQHLLVHRSDKEELRKGATFKIFFTKGINVERLLEWWKVLLQSDYSYDKNSYNCCDVVLHSLQYALDEDIPDISDIKTSRMRDNRHRDTDILNSHRYEMSPQSGTKSTTIYQYCYLLGKLINQTVNYQVSPVIVRYCRYNHRLRNITSFDFDPSKFNPNWMTNRKKIRKEDIYSQLINHSFSEILFENIDPEKEKKNDAVAPPASPAKKTFCGLKRGFLG